VWLLFLDAYAADFIRLWVKQCDRCWLLYGKL
jgi:hypothetical protein